MFSPMVLACTGLMVGANSRVEAGDNVSDWPKAETRMGVRR